MLRKNQFGLRVKQRKPGLKITAGHWTMSGEDDRLSGQNLGWAVIVTGHAHSFQINNQENKFILINSGNHKQLNHKIS